MNNFGPRRLFVSKRSAFTFICLFVYSCLCSNSLFISFYFKVLFEISRRQCYVFHENVNHYHHHHHRFNAKLLAQQFFCQSFCFTFQALLKSSNLLPDSGEQSFPLRLAPSPRQKRLSTIASHILMRNSSSFY